MERARDANLLRQLIAFAVTRLVALEIGTLPAVAISACEASASETAGHGSRSEQMVPVLSVEHSGTPIPGAT